MWGVGVLTWCLTFKGLESRPATSPCRSWAAASSQTQCLCGRAAGWEASLQWALEMAGTPTWDPWLLGHQGHVSPFKDHGTMALVDACGSCQGVSPTL